MKANQIVSKVFYISCLFILTACSASREQVAATMAVQTIEARATGTAIIEQAVNNALEQTAAASTSTPMFTSTSTLMPTSLSSPTATSNPNEYSDIDPSGNTIPMRLVPAGEFSMGSNLNDALAECQKHRNDCLPEWFTDEEPPHQVELDAFYMDQYEVTNALYKACVNANICDSPTLILGMEKNTHYAVTEFDNHPVTFVKWDMASDYCEWRGARLPSEAEWEKAARGADERTYPWGEGIDCTKANYFNSTLGCGGDTSEVGSYQSGISLYGMYDMAGNVMEWVDEWYAAYPGNTTANKHYGTIFRVARGGSYSRWYNDQRSSDRVRWIPDAETSNLGFRCARSLSSTQEPTANLTPTKTPSNSTQSLTATPQSTSGFVSGHASWESTGVPVAGVQLMFGEGSYTLGEGELTDTQGNYSTEVKPGSFYVNLTWSYADQSDVPCSDLDFTLLGEWTVFPVQLNAGGYLILATSQKISVEAGEEVKLDIQFICQ